MGLTGSGPRRAVSSPAVASPHAALYDAVAERLARAVADRPEAAHLPVPACPEWTVGGPQPAGATLTAGRHDLLRSITGRRTHTQISALRWSAPAAGFLPAFRWGPFSPPLRPVE